MKHNSYFNGRVQSLGLNTTKGYATIGVIDPGKYTFSTESEEHMTVISGILNVKLPDGNWHEFAERESFIIPPKKSFEVETKNPAGYICYYK